MKKMTLALAISLALAGFEANAAPQTTDGENKGLQKKAQQKSKKADIEHIQIISHQDKLRTEAGSATLLTEEKLGEYEYDDIHRILSQVPGVNIREEDGYGLRPNIGFRGVTPERSKKITILEDGVLIGPAPYSAPAAYYFPVTTRMTAVEVFKGPAAIKYGPQTVAGTLNMVTRQVPEFSEGGLDLALGSDGYKKAHAYYGNSQDNLGFLIEGVHLEADGFKQLDGGGNTGFDKNDLLAKVAYNIEGKQFNQRLELKLSYADELSDETYLGLTANDFAATPYRRYATSQDAQMDTRYQQIMFTHQLNADDWQVTTRIYDNRYERAWRKLNGIKDSSADLSTILANPDTYSRQYQVISGQADSVSAGETNTFLKMGTNDREYYSKGVQINANWQVSLFNLDHTLSAGLRYHKDEIERKHFEQIYAMQNGKAVKTEQAQYFTTQNTESTAAWSVFVEDKITLDKLTLGVGVRGELMDMHYQNNTDPTDWQDKTTRIWLPGVSGFYQLSQDSGLLFGVHQGFVPSSPAQSKDIKLEKSINYEFGGRFNNGVSEFEIVSFFNDYDNLKESCSQSNCGDATQLDQEFNGGKVNVYGLETQFAQRYPFNLQLDIPYSLVYTYTKSEFKNEIYSEFAQWGHVRKGDRLPYLPTHQATFNIGLAHSDWALNMAIKYVSEMPEVAGTSWSSAAQGEVFLPLEGKKIPATTTVDVSARYELGRYGQIYAKIDNLFDQHKLVSRRPYGARPAKPRQFALGYKYQF